MTPEHLDDNALSATLDGEATPDEHAHVDACTTCRARVDELRAAANAIGTPLTAVDPVRRDQAIAAALLALPTPLASRRRRQPPGWVLGAAAAVLALGILVPLVNRSSGSSDDRSATAAADGNARSKALESPEAQDSSGAAGATQLFATDSVDLGPITSDDELRDRVLDALRTPAPGTPTSTTAPATASTVADPCVATLTGKDATLGALRLDARATVDGNPSRVLVFDAGGDPPTVRAFAVTDACDVLRSTTIPAP
ncbi:MAG: hypothetical protein JWN67_2134 [Actinomycetia bacterium]|nr:hypothetical protein [Actinomycetes bacterium]